MTFEPGSIIESAYLRANGEYVLLTEDAGHHRVIRTRGCARVTGPSTPAVRAALQPQASPPGR